ncbi:MAG: nuclear transport factor 2 family protein [Proteobacteria bacterium]|nr:nuclear transport factor 2 family protein [Pseudomonadota bacterium]
MSDQDKRQNLIDMVVNKYFANVDAKKLQPVLDCFWPDVEFTIQTAFHTHTGRDSGVKKMFENLFESYPKKIWHGNFRHVVDTGSGHIASQFDVDLIDKDGKQTLLSNCNFFWLENGKFKRVFVYMSGENVLR